MASTKKIAVVFLMLQPLFEVSLGAPAFHKVGESSGWTTTGNVDYNKWTSSRDFYVGDSLLFQYNNQFHNVKQVTHQDFLSCNAASPVATYTSGSDSITLERAGHYYFLSGFPGNCQAGQKVDVLVTPPSIRPIGPRGSLHQHEKSEAEEIFLRLIGLFPDINNEMRKVEEDMMYNSKNLKSKS